MLEGKRVSCGVRIQHCHANNGAFSDRSFVDEVHKCGQTTLFCAANTPHQNGRAEKKIRDLKETARTMMLHTKQPCPGAITANLWPFAIRMANVMSNGAPTNEHGAILPQRPAPGRSTPTRGDKEDSSRSVVPAKRSVVALHKALSFKDAVIALKFFHSLARCFAIEFMHTLPVHCSIVWLLVQLQVNLLLSLFATEVPQDPL